MCKRTSDILLLKNSTCFGACNKEVGLAFMNTRFEFTSMRTRQKSKNYGPQMCGANKFTGKLEFVYYGISEFHCLVKVLFSAMFSCFLLDSFEPRSLRSTSQGVLTARVMMNMLAT